MYKRMRRTEVKSCSKNVSYFLYEKATFSSRFSTNSPLPSLRVVKRNVDFWFSSTRLLTPIGFFFAISANFARKKTTTTPIVREKQFALSIRAWTKKKSLWYSPLLFFKGHIWSNGDWLRHEPFNSFLLWKSRGKSLPSCQGLSLLYDSKESTKKPFSSL